MTNIFGNVSGKKLSLETENKLLALLAYENARKKVKSAPVKGIYMHPHILSHYKLRV